MTVQRILLRRDTAANWTAANPVLALGEEGVETDTLRRKLGDGVTPWSGLPYATALPSDVTAAQTADQGYTDSKMAGEVTRADGKYVAASALDAAMAADVRPGGSATAAAIAADPALRAAFVTATVAGDDITLYLNGQAL